MTGHPYCQDKAATGEPVFDSGSLWMLSSGKGQMAKILSDWQVRNLFGTVILGTDAYGQPKYEARKAADAAVRGGNGRPGVCAGLQAGWTVSVFLAGILLIQAGE